MALGINYNDPRYQKAVLAAGANPLATQGMFSNIQSRFVTNQMGNLMAFRQQALTKSKHDDRIGLARRRLNLENKMFNRSYGLAKDKLSDEKRALNFTSIFGTATGIYSALEGQRRREETQKLTAENRAWRERVEKRQAEHDKTIEDILRSRV